jgi:hypothetical protein
MPEALLLASKALFAVTGCGAGIRLAQTARRGRVPRHMWAAAMIFVGGFGLVGFGMGPALAEHAGVAARGLMIAADALERLSLLGLAVFIWHVFARGSRSGAILLAAVLVAMTASWTYVLLVQRWPEPILDASVAVASQLAFAAPFVWSTWESALALLRERRELARGRGDAIACNRLLLWTLGSPAFAAICFATALAALLGASSPLAPALATLRAFLYAALSGIVALAFFPPASYLRWLARGAPVPARA